MMHDLILYQELTGGNRYLVATYHQPRFMYHYRFYSYPELQFVMSVNNLEDIYVHSIRITKSIH